MLGADDFIWFPFFFDRGIKGSLIEAGGRPRRMGERRALSSIPQGFLLTLLLCCLGGTAGAQQKAANDTLLVCTACHVAKDGKLDSIDSVRMTPEGWRMTLSRMVRNHGLQLNEEEAHKILKYLADNNGLAPSEVSP